MPYEGLRGNDIMTDHWQQARSYDDIFFVEDMHP